MSDNPPSLMMISVAARYLGMHPQTLRVYETRGLISPSRSSGNTRLYSLQDLQKVKRIAQLTQEGLTLAGALRVIELEQRVEALQQQLDALR